MGNCGNRIRVGAGGGEGSGERELEGIRKGQRQRSREREGGPRKGQGQRSWRREEGQTARSLGLHFHFCHNWTVPVLYLILCLCRTVGAHYLCKSLIAARQRTE
jgi:hypothetical protein